MKKLLLLILVCLTCYCRAQSNMVVITSTVPSSLTICGAAQHFSITIYNPTPFIITRDTVQVTMPIGIQYDSFINGPLNSGYAGGGISTPRFYLPDIAPLTSITITFSAKAQCNVLTFISGGGITKNDIKITYVANNIAGQDMHSTISYLIKQPYLAITAVTNQSYSGTIGAVFQRCITIINSGSGELNGFSFTDTHGSGVQINATSVGTLTHVNATVDRIVIDSNAFAAIGDGDKLFENGESITICETVTILNCVSAASAFRAFWGCSVNACQASTANANVVFPNYVPNLVITPIPSMNTCITDASLQQLRIVNAGLGSALHISLDIFQSTGGGYHNSTGSYIDENSFTVQEGLSGTPTALPPSTTQATAVLNCMTNKKGRVVLSIPDMEPGDTLYLKWNTYTCCYDKCSNTGRSYSNGWRYKGTYKSLCQTNYVIAEAWGRNYANIYADLTDNGSPSTLSNVQTGNFNFMFSNYGNSYPLGPGGHWKFEITLPSSPCLSYVPGTLHILRANGIQQWAPTSITTTGNLLTVIFNGNPPWTLNQAELKFQLALNCAACGNNPGGNNAIGVKAYFIPNNTCSCQIGVSCINFPININCPAPCVGMEFTYFDIKRTNFGLPDNEANGGNGIPDGTGSLDFTKVKAIRAMFGDTVKGSFNGRISTNLTYPNWDYCFARERLSQGNKLTYIDAQLRIYRGGSLIATCNNFTPTITDSSNVRIFNYNLSPGVLGGCFTGPYLNDDSVVFEPRYKVTTNIGNAAPLICVSSNWYYTSDIPNPTPHISPGIDSTHKFQCATYNGSFTIIGYWFRSWNPDGFDTKSCNNVILHQGYYLSIGPDGGNYAGGNLFPNEYRHWAHIDTLKAAIPSGYSLISARFNQRRTAGTLLTNTSAWINLTPLNPNSDTLLFPVEQYFQGYGGTIPLGDDGWDGDLEITLQPGCEVVPSVYHDITYDWRFAPAQVLTEPGSDSTYIIKPDDHVLYDPPDLFVQSLLPTVFALNTTTTWDVLISNTSNTSDAMNTWITAPVVSGVTITNVYDLDNNVNIPVSGSIYQVGTVSAMGVRKFRLTGTFTSCNSDTIGIYIGWNCFDGYPTNLASYPCTPERITLTLNPLTPAFLVNTKGPATVDLCDSAEYTVEGINVQLGTGYNIKFRATLPPGTSYAMGTSFLTYPDTNSYVSIANPTITGNVLEWNISAANALIGTDGLKGLLQDSLNSFRLKFKVVTLPDCNFVPGSQLYFVLLGEAACGLATELDLSISPPLYITGATQPYTSNINLRTTFLSPCAENSVMTVRVTNMGPPSFGSTDSVLIKLPVGINFVSGSFASIHNAPLNGTPLQYTSGGNTYLVWRLPPGTVAGDSSVFSFEYRGNPHTLPCGIVFFESKAYSVSVLSCVGQGITCVTNITTGTATLPVFTYKAYLALSNGSGTAAPAAPNHEIVTLNFDIINTGEAILTEADSIIQFYYDADNDSVYSSGDIFITQDTVIIPKDSTLHYTKAITVNAGQTCSIIAVVDPNVNPCVCTPAQINIRPPLFSLGNDSTVCSGTSISIGTSAITGYTYSWTPSTGLSDTATSNPVLNTSNLTSTPVTTQYILVTNRIGCSSNDTIAITVNPIPPSNAGDSISLCPGDSGEIGTESTTGYTYLWTPANGLNDTTISNPTVSHTIPNSYTYVVTTTSLGCSSKDTVVVTVNPFPVSNAGTNIHSCVDTTPATLGTTTTTGYSYQWTPSTGLSNDTISNPTVTLLAADTTDYIVTTTALGCVSHDTVRVTIAPLPTATIVGTTTVCKDDPNPIILFTGANATPPYTFTYTVNNGANQTVTTTGSNDTVSITVSTTTADTLVYTLVSVQESSSMACLQLQDSSATIIINPLPVATITGTTQVCQNDTAPTILLTGANGTAPYTFTYRINTGAAQTITSTGDSVSIPVSTTVADTFKYVLISVTDASSTTCSQLQSDSATIIVNPLPIAHFGFNNVCLNQSMYFNDSSAVATGTINLWSWDFGDGSAAFTAQNPVYIYQSHGTFNVSLIAITNSGCTDTVKQSVTVHPLPDAQFTTNPAAVGICDGTPITFNDASTIATPDIIQNWDWNFGDGTPVDTNQNTSHLYNSPATYTVVLTVTSDFGCTDTINRLVTVNPNPVVNFTGTPTIGCEPLCVSFTDSSSLSNGNNVSWTWDIGNGSTIGNSQTFEQCFSNDSISGSMNMNIQLTVTSDSGCVATLVKNNFITIHPKPQAAFSVDPQVTTVINTQVSVRDSSLNTISWFWDFGDGNTSNIANPPPNTYPHADTGTYLITLITYSPNGCEDTAYQSVIIEGDFTFFIPNAFTPDGDNINDYFFGKGTGIIEYDLWIFDRWGNMLYHGQEIPVENSRWDGKANGGKEVAQMDVYVWKVNLTDMFGNNHKYIGTVTLVR